MRNVVAGGMFFNLGHFLIDGNDKNSSQDGGGGDDEVPNPEMQHVLFEQTTTPFTC